MKEAGYLGSSGQLELGMGKGEAGSRWGNGNCGAQQNEQRQRAPLHIHRKK